MPVPLTRWWQRLRQGPSGPSTAPDGPAALTADPTEPNRIIAARREFAGAFGDLARGKRNWQLMAFATTALLIIMTVSYVQLAGRSRFVPYVIEVDRLGQVAANHVIDPLAQPDDRLVSAELARFVRAVRTVLPAAAQSVQADLLRRAYALAGPDVATFLNAYFARPDHDPRLLGARLAREVDIRSVLRVPRSAVWMVKWTETDHPIEPGTVGKSEGWEAYATVRLAPPTRLEGLEDNPLGLSITSLTWTRVSDPSAPEPPPRGSER